MARDICETLKRLQKGKRVMSLLESALENFTIINKSIVDDGYGSTTTQWTEGATIKGTIVLDTSTQMKIAQAMGVMANYTLIIQKSADLDYHDVIRRDSDGKIFRIVSGTDERKTPDGAGLNMLEYDTEEWTLA